MKAEYRRNAGCLKGNSAEHERTEGAPSVHPRDGGERDGANLMEQILSRRNLNRAYKKVKENKGAPGIDGMSVQEVFDWLRENKDELVRSIREGWYKPNPVRRKSIPKPDGGVRNLGIPTVIDRIIQQAMAQVLTDIYDSTFSDDSYGYRPGKQAHQAIRRVREYANEGYTQVASLDLSRYFDTVNHDLLLQTLRERIKDERVIKLIKKYLKAGVMDNGVVVPSEEGVPQGGPLSPLLANIYLDAFDKIMESRGVRFVRYADDINCFAKSERAATRLMENARKILEEKLKLKMNTEKSQVVSVYGSGFKFLGFTLGKDQRRAVVHVHYKSLRRAKAKLKEFTRRNQGRNVEWIMYKEMLYAKGWLGYYRLGQLKTRLERWDGWRRRRYRAYIWKQWKVPKKRIEMLMKYGVSEDKARALAYSRKKYWRIAASPTLNSALTNEVLKSMGFFSMSEYYEAKRLIG